MDKYGLYIPTDSTDREDRLCCLARWIDGYVHAAAPIILDGYDGGDLWGQALIVTEIGLIPCGHWARENRGVTVLADRYCEDRIFEGGYTEYVNL